MKCLVGNTWDHTRGFDPVANTVEAFIGERDVEITWQRRSLQAFADQPVDELARDFDLIVVDHPHVGQVAQDGCLLAIDDHLPAEVLDELARDSVGRSHDSYNIDGRQWALAIDAACQVSALRRDRIGQAPTTWDEVFELAATGRVLWPLKPVDSICSFETVAANLGQPCAEGGRFVEVDHGVRVLELLARGAQLVPDACLSMNPFEVLEILAEDDTYAYCPLLFGYTNYSRSGYRKNIVESVDIPVTDGSPRGSILGGAGIAVSSRTAHPELAAEYAAWLASGKVQRTIYVENGGQPAHKDAWDDPAANRLCADFFRNTRSTIELSWLRPRHAGFIEFQDRAGALINTYLREGGDARSVVATLNDVYEETA